MKRFLCAALCALIIISFPGDLSAAAKKAAKIKDAFNKVRNFSAVITEVNAAGNYVTIKEGKKNKKIMAEKAVIVRSSPEEARVITLSGLTVNAKAQFLLSKEKISGGYKALVITQVFATDTAAASTDAVQFASAGIAGSEGITTINIPVVLAKAAVGEVKVTYTVSGAATGGTDYNLVNGQVTIPAGQTSASIPLTVIDDTALESDETVIVTLSAPIGATLGAAAVYTYIIQDNDQPRVQFSAAASSGSEGAGTINLQLALAQVLTAETRISYTIGGTALPGVDFGVPAGPALIPAGQSVTNIPVTLIDDQTFEGDETIVITLSSATGASLGTTTVHTYTITDNDNPRVQFSAATSSGAESATPVNLQLSLSTLHTQAVTVSYSITGTATGGGTDYTLAAGTATVAVGQTTVNIPLIVIDDGLDELDETVIVTLSNPVNATLGTTTAHTYTITDNDQPTVQFAATASNGAESTTPANLQVTLSAASPKDVRVSYAVGVSSTATGNSDDYTLANADLTIPAGQTSGNIVITVSNDGIAEGNETVIVTLSAPVDAMLGGNATHTYTINNDD